MEGLGLDNVLGAEEVEKLFSGNGTQDDDNSSQENNNGQSNQGDQGGQGKGNNAHEDDNNDTVETSLLNWVNGKSEGVGSEEDKGEGGEHQSSNEDEGTPNNKSIFSSMAKSLRDEGVFPDLTDEEIEKIKDAGDFRKMFDDQNSHLLDERQKRIEKALNAGAEPDEVSNYERTLNFLNSIKEEVVTEEGERGETLRKQLLMQDFLNHNYPREEAEGLVQKSLDAGTDVEDAKRALENNKRYYKAGYENYLKEVEESNTKAQEEQNKEAEKLKKQIMEEKDFFGGVQVDKVTRQKVYDNIMKPTYKDPESGRFMTKLQQYQKEHPMEFIKNMGLLFTLTDNFKNMDKLVKTQVKQGMKKGFEELEHVLNNTARKADGSLNFESGQGSYGDNREKWTLADI